MGGSRRESVVVGGLCLLWYSVSSASGVVGKLVLSRFPFPLTVTLVQLSATVLLSAPTFAIAGVRRPTQFPRDYYWRVLVPLAFAKFLTTLFSQISIWKVPISYAHTVKATTPLWTAVLGRLVLGSRVSRGVALALLLIASGVGVASATELHFSAVGLSAALAAAALLAAQHIASKRVMRDTNVHHLRLLQISTQTHRTQTHRTQTHRTQTHRTQTHRTQTHRTQTHRRPAKKIPLTEAHARARTLSWLALALFLPVWAWLEGREAGLAAVAVGWGTGVLLAADGALAWAQAVVAFSVLSRISPLGYGVAGAAKRVVVVAASLIVLRNPTSPANLAGMVLAAAGVLAYNRAKHLDTRDTPLLPVTLTL